MEEQKILFADLYRLMGAARSELKMLGKQVESLLLWMDWDSLSLTTNEIISLSARIGNIAQAMIDATDTFLQNGPYEGERKGVTPLEGLANDETD